MLALHVVIICAGLAHAGLGDVQKALKDYNRAIRLWPDWPEPYEARAEAYKFVGDSARAAPTSMKHVVAPLRSRHECLAKLAETLTATRVRSSRR